MATGNDYCSNLIAFLKKEDIQKYYGESFTKLVIAVCTGDFVSGTPIITGYLRSETSNFTLFINTAVYPHTLGRYTAVLFHRSFSLTKMPMENAAGDRAVLMYLRKMMN